MGNVKPVPAVVLAGGHISHDLGSMAGASYRAVIPLAGRPMVEYVLQALREAECISQVVLVGPDEVQAAADAALFDDAAPSGSGLAESLFNGIQRLDQEGEVLAVTGDIPLLTPLATCDFVDRALASGADVSYCIIPKEDCEARFPGARRTYAHVREGRFTGGNFTLLRADIAAAKEDLIRRLYLSRKSVFQLANILGPSFVIRLAFGMLGIEDVERRAAQILGARVKAVISHHPEIGFDVDKPSDLEAVRSIMEG
jgi:CTP:molybdopterin cytidylyltransferase MocA